jgi:preprotein translocase subunit SecA
MLSSSISTEDSSLIIKLAQKLEIVDYIEKLDATNLGKYILGILTQGLSKELTTEIVDLKLPESKLIKRFSPEVRDNINLVLGLEKAFIEDNIESIIDQCFKLVKSGRTFPAKYWDKLESRFNDKRVKEILSTLVEYESEKIIAGIKERFIGYLKSKDNFLEDIKAGNSIIKMLVRVKGLKITELEEGFLKEALSNEVYRVNILEVIELAILNIQNNGKDKNKEESELLEELQAELKKIAIEEPYAAWILGLLDKNSPFFKVRDHKSDLSKRQEALNQVLDQISTGTEKIKFLAKLVQQDSELRVSAFEKLVTELSNADESLLKNVNINSVLVNITESLNYRNIGVSSIIALIGKFRELVTRFQDVTIAAKELGYTIDLLPVFNWLTDHALLIGDGKQVLLNQLEINTGNFNDFLKELTQSLIDKSTDAKIIADGLIRIAFLATNKEIRQNAIWLIESKLDRAIIDGSINDIFDKLKQLSILIINEQTLKFPYSLKESGSVISYPTRKNPIQLVKELSSMGYLITEDQIQSLFDLIHFGNHKEYHEEIVSILLQVSRNQPISSSNFLSIKADLEHLLSEGVTEELLTIFVIASRDQEFRLKQESILRLGKFLSASSNDLDMRITAAVILDKQIRRLSRESIAADIAKISSLIRDVAVAEGGSDNHNQLISIVFQTLDFLAIDEQRLDSGFINDYYRSLSRRLFDIENGDQGVEWLTRYIANPEISNKNKYLLLRVLNQSVAVIGRYRTKDLITKHEEVFSLRDVLEKILLECIDTKSFKEEEDFKKYINNLSKVIEAGGISHTTVTTEDILFDLIRHQGKTTHRPNLTQVNNILWILGKSEEAREVVPHNNLRNPILELTKSYLIGRFNSYVYQIQEADTDESQRGDLQEIEGLVDQLAQSITDYRIEIIDQLFDKKNLEVIKIKTKKEFITDLIKFFRVMESYQFTTEEREQFFLREIKENSTVADWSIKFYTVVAAKLIAMRIPDIVHFNPALRDCSQSILYKSIFQNNSANAYNQAGKARYYYTGNDIDRISSLWMKDFNDSRHVNYALELSNGQNIYEVLSRVLKAYKENKDNKPLYIPLNIAANHWVSLVVLPNAQLDESGKTQTIVLYKDSLGDTYNHEREEVEDILKETFGDDLVFKFSKSSEQINGSSSGIFTLANLKMIASNIVSNCATFINDFENNQAFATEEQIDDLRKKDFPTLYVLSLCESYKRSYVYTKIKNHHKSEVETAIFQKILEDAGIDKTQVAIGILPVLPSRMSDGNYVDYTYRYQIKIHDEITPFDAKKIQIKITDILRKSGIEYQLYGKDTIVIGSEQPVEIIKDLPKVEKLTDLANIKVADYIHEKEFKELEKYLGISDPKILRVQIGLEDSVEEAIGSDVVGEQADGIVDIRSDSSSVLKAQNLALIKASKWGESLHLKIARVLRTDSTQENLSFSLLNSIDRLLSKVDDDDKLKNLAQTLDIVYDYDLKADDVDGRTGKSLVEILNGSGDWAHEVHQLAINKSFVSGSQSLTLQELRTEILNLNPEFNREDLDSLLGKYDDITQAEKGTSLFYQLSLIQLEQAISELTQVNSKEKSISILEIIKNCSKTSDVNNLEKKVGELFKDYELELGKPGLSAEKSEKLFTLMSEGINKLLDQFKKGIKTIKEWGEEEIKAWSAGIKNKPFGNSEKEKQQLLYEKLAVAKRGVQVFHNEKITPRDIQMLSVLLLLNNKQDHGRLAQIKTGEGKTTIVAMLAVIKALEGIEDPNESRTRIHQVDIITSSSELAKPQSEEQKKYFALFDLTVSHNSSGSDMEKQETYKANIVYGAASDFQGDILRDEYNKLGTRGGRKCTIAIVDEVDSMLIDGKNHIVMLSNPMPAMDYLEPVLATIWNQLLIASQHIVEDENGNIVYREQQYGIDVDGEERTVYTDQLLEGKTKLETLKKVTESYVRKLLRGKILESGKYEYQELLDLTLEEIEELQNQDRKLAEYEDKLRQRLSVDEKAPLSHPRIEIPQHLRSLVLSTQLPKWIDSAISAMFRYDIGKHYILKDDRFIAPVDASNTGIVQGNMIWSDGLHQFLQLKHGCKITPESLTTNLISNVAFFKRYGDKIFGLTGTLGSSKARELLHKHYKLDSVIIPPFRNRRYKELTSIISNTENTWYRNIAESCLSKLEQKRGVLVITKYITEVERLKELLETEYHYPADKIKVYKTEKDAAVAKQELKDGEIILATNIAGRGTDIKPSAIIEENGGLHVCVTFLPTNQRVEDQNIGRTSRTGNKGTAQFVLLDQNSNLDVLRIKRNGKERLDLKRADSEIRKVLIKDKWFEQFCDLLGTIDKSAETKDKSIYIKAVEERFAVWLKEQDKALEGIENICQQIEEDSSGNSQEPINKLIEEFTTAQFESFKQVLGIKEGKEIAKNSLVKNPTFFVLEGNKLLNTGSAAEAIDFYTKAINLEPYFAVNAYYNRACARIAAYGETDQYVVQGREAIEDLKEARRIIEENLKPLLSIIQKSSKSELILEQLEHKLALYNTQIQAIDAAIGQGDGYAENQLQQLEKQLANGEVEQVKINLIEAFIEEYKYKLIEIGDMRCLAGIKLRLQEIRSKGQFSKNEKQLFDELLNSIEQKEQIVLDFIESPLAILAIDLFDKLLSIQQSKLEALQKSTNSEHIKNTKKISEDISKLESSIQEIIADKESLREQVSDNTDLTAIIRRLTRYRNILEKDGDQGIPSIKEDITNLDNLIIKLSGVSTYSDRLKVLEESKKSLLVDKEYKTRTREELSKKNTESSKNNIKELDTLIRQIERQIEEVDQSISTISAQASKIDSIRLIKLDLEISILETYRKDLRGMSDSEKKGISDQKAGFFKKDKKGKPTSEKDTDGINKIEKGIIGVSLSNKHKMKMKFKPMREALSEEENPDLFVEEIREYENNGCIGTFEVEEIKPIPWWSVIGLFLIGLVQLVAGAVLTVCTLGVMASVGSGLMSEGVSDMITAVKDGIINRDFNWESWGIQKAISLAVSVICAGLSALKNAVMAAFKTAQTAAKAVVETAKQVVQSTWKLVAKSAAIALAKGVAKECVTQLVDYGVSKAVMPNIEEEIRKLFEPVITKTLTESDSVRMMFELDAKNGNKRYESQIKKRAMAILSSESGSQNGFGAALKTVLQQVALSQIPGLSTAKKAYDALAAIGELAQILPNFIEELEKVIDEIATIAKHEKENTGSLEQRSQSQNVNTTDSSIMHMSTASHEERDAGDIDLSNANRNHQQAKKAQVEVRSSDEITRVMSVGLASTATAIIASKLIKPATDSLVGFGIDKCFSGVEKRQEERIKARHEHRAKLKIEAAAKEAAKKEEENKKRKADERFNKDKTKAEEQLHSGTQKFSPRDEDDIKGYAEREKEHIVIKDKEGRIIAEFGKEYASSNGKEPVTLIKSAGDVNGITHYEAPSGHKTTDTYSCVADAIAAQTGQTPHQVEALMHANESYVERTNMSWDDLGNIDAWQNLQRERGLGGVDQGSIELGEDGYYVRLYRSLAPNEPDPMKFGLSSRGDRTDRFSVARHLADTQPDSGWISTTENPDVVLSYIDEKNGRVAELLIPVNRESRHLDLNGSIGVRGRGNSVSIIDLTTRDAQHRFFTDIDRAQPGEDAVPMPPLFRNGRQIAPMQAYNSALNSREVLISRIPPRFVVALHEADDFRNAHQQGSDNRLKNSRSVIYSLFCEYTMEVIHDILVLRMQAEASNTELTNTMILPGTYIFSDKHSNIHALLFYLNLYIINIMLQRNKHVMNRIIQPVILAPISLYGKHAVGVMFVAQEDGSGYKAFYLDPENTTIPEGLATIFKDNGYEIEQLPTEGQKYTNCGPEVIENFMLYLTGERLSQEDAIVNNSRLVEQELLSYDGTIKEDNCLTLKDSCSKQDTGTTISNTLYNTQVNSNGYIIDNPTRYDIVTPQGIIDRKMVNLKMLMEPKDLLLEVLTDHNSVIDQDYAERIMGDVYLTD